ncbi:MAG TPA: hypothetical protein PLR99_26445 [Polyangiaceae bacterium]|nr:hypothetical protein [Polyangiaceae bacterium]
MNHDPAHGPLESTHDLPEWPPERPPEWLPEWLLRGREVAPSPRRPRRPVELGDSLRLRWWTSGASGTRPKGYPSGARRA